MNTVAFCGDDCLEAGAIDALDEVAGLIELSKLALKNAAVFELFEVLDVDEIEEAEGRL